MCKKVSLSHYLKSSEGLIGAHISASNISGIMDTNRNFIYFLIFFQTIGVPVTPEEKHVANMQINGYENPTYKYFEVKE